MPARIMANRKLDARPDRPDLRDRIYNPSLRSLPPVYPSPDLIEQFFSEYTESFKLILDQGKEGACTGYGLAALINYVQFSEFVKRDRKGDAPVRVSPWMLYDLARRYDEWPGEDYEGSSCRGAMKGWFHHGVCQEKFWTAPARSQKKRAQDGWNVDSANRPLGAYYRIDKNSISDLQAAIFEVGAIYVSADVHAGWEIPATSRLQVLKWKESAPSTGGHAFALVGYTKKGFIVQNSWGQSWGYKGFAILSYADWLTNGDDAWVAVLGAPAEGPAAEIILSSSRVVGKIAPYLGNGLANGANAKTTSAAPESGHWPLKETVDHALIVGHRGKPERVTVGEDGLSEAIETVVFDNPSRWFSQQAQAKKRLLLYVHGGLNDLDDGILRTSVLGPYFKQNGIYPIFAVWRSGFIEQVRDIVETTIDEQIKSGLLPSQAINKKLFEAASEAFDYLVERALTIPGSAIWENMKKRCVDATTGEGAIIHFLAGLRRLTDKFPDIELHLVGHSAGAVMIGSLLKQLRVETAVRTCSLYAPACTAGFALDTYIPAIRKGLIKVDDIKIDLLSDNLERDDTVFAYRKSLLYLVSRAFEEHKTPLLGMEGLWTDVDSEPFKNNERAVHPDVARWRKAWANANGSPPRVLTKPTVKTGPNTTAKSTHGCFDNWVQCISYTINRIRGEAEGTALPKPVGRIIY